MVVGVVFICVVHSFIEDADTLCLNTPAMGTGMIVNLSRSFLQRESFAECYKTPKQLHLTSFLND